MCIQIFFSGQRLDLQDEGKRNGNIKDKIGNKKKVFGRVECASGFKISLKS